MALFPLLADPETYRPCEADLLVDEAGRDHWVTFFQRHFETLLETAAARGVADAALRGARDEFIGEMKLIEAEPDRHGRLDILLLDELRDGALRRQGITDVFKPVKDRENEQALRFLPKHLARVDATPEPERLGYLVRCILAGNLFDMGAKETAQRFGETHVPFDDVLESVPSRPWLVDDLDAANESWMVEPPRKAVVFADNAGADVVLGVLPLVRAMLERGAEVVLSANTRPTLNDVTHDELTELLARAAPMDGALGSSRLTLVASGNGAPLIDLRRVSDELAHASLDADLVVLVGMGRSVESNHSARFTCPVWKIAMIKDAQVAESLGGAMFDAVFKAD